MRAKYNLSYTYSLPIPKEHKELFGEIKNKPMSWNMVDVFVKALVPMKSEHILHSIKNLKKYHTIIFDVNEIIRGNEMLKVFYITRI